MLVVSRYEGERVWLDFSSMSDEQLLALRDDPRVRVELSLERVTGDRSARVGVRAPRELAVYRIDRHGRREGRIRV